MTRFRLLALALFLVPLVLRSPSRAAAPSMSNPKDPASQAENNNQTGPTNLDPAKDGDPVILPTGSFEQTETDLFIEGRGLDFAFTRTYRSGSSITSSIGNQWDFNFNKRIVLRFQGGVVPNLAGYPIGNQPNPTGSLGNFSLKVDGKQIYGAQAVGGTGSTASFPSITNVFYYHDLRIDALGAPGSFYRTRTTATNSANIPTQIELREPDGIIYTFGALSTGTGQIDGWVLHLTKIEDPNGNSIELKYSILSSNSPFKGPVQRATLDYILDSYGRRIDFGYASSFIKGGFIRSITDFDGRKVEYDYDEEGNLISVSGPTITAGGSNENKGFVGNPVTKYRYQGGSGKQRLTQIIAPTEVADLSETPYVTNVYEGERVVKQIFGGTNASGVEAGGTFLFLHEEHQIPIQWNGFREFSRVLRVDPNGNCELKVFDEAGHDPITWEFTGRLDPETLDPLTNPSTLVSIDPDNIDPDVPAGTVDCLVGALPPLREGEDYPDQCSYITRKEFNADGLLSVLDSPSERIEYEYDDEGPREKHANILKTTRVSKEAGSSEEFVTLSFYEPYFNKLIATVDERGTTAGFQAPNGNGGSASPAHRYMTRIYYDYQEQMGPVPELDALEADWSVDPAVTAKDQAIRSAYNIDLGALIDLGDLNGSGGLETALAGNPIRTLLPEVEEFSDPKAGGFVTSGTIETLQVFNADGLVTSSTDPEGNQTTYAYGPVPTGGGTPKGTFGFLESVTNVPTGVKSSFQYDTYGRVTRRTNGRGYPVDMAYDAADNLVYTKELLGTSGTDGYETWMLHDANGNRVGVEVEDVRPQLSANGHPTGLQVTSTSNIVHAYTYDILDELIEEELDTGGLKLVTKYRRDKLGNIVLTLNPELNTNPTGEDHSDFVSRVYDERNMLYQETRGGLAPAFSGLLANDDIDTTALGLVSAAYASTTKTFYDERGNESVHVDADQFEWKSFYDGFNRLIEYRYPTSITTHFFTWDPAGNQIEKVTISSLPPFTVARIRTKHDELGRVYETGEAILAPTSVPAPADPMGTLTPGDGYLTSRVKYDKNGNVVTTVDDNGVDLHFLYDGLNRVEEQRDSDGNIVAYTYDAAGNVEVLTETETGAALPYTTTTTYDALNRPVMLQDNLGQTSQSLYDSRGNLVFSSDPTAGAGYGNTTHYIYDHLSRLLETKRQMRVGGSGGAVIDTNVAGDGLIRTLQSYDRDSRLKTQTDDNGNVTTHEYDGLGRRTKTIFADLTEESWTYTNRDQVHVHTKPNGFVLTHTYNEHNLLERRVATLHGAPYDIEDYTYDGLNRMVFGSDNDSSVTRTYDSVGRLLEETQFSGRTVRANYEGWRHTDLIYPTAGRTVRRTYDTLGRVDQILDLQTGNTVADYAYEGPARVKTRDNLWADTTTTIEYDGLRRITRTRHDNNGVAFDNRTYGWSPASIKTWRYDAVRDIRHEYSYDSVYQLVQSDRITDWSTTPSTQTVTYQLDGVTNRKSVTGGLNPGSYLPFGDPVSPTNDPVNEYSGTPQDLREYDACGNLIKITPLGGGPIKNLSYDHRNQMVACDLVGPSLFEYAYDVLGRRIWKEVDDGTGPVRTEFSYWGFQVLEESLSAGGASVHSATYMYGLGLRDTLVREIQGLTTNWPYFYHADELGSVTAITELNAGVFAVAEAYGYSDFGVVLDAASGAVLAGSGLSVPNPVFFQGQRVDWESGLYLFGYRYFDARAGRFLTRDPLGEWTDGHNLGNGFGFGGNCVWSREDPLGLISRERAAQQRANRAARRKAQKERRRLRAKCKKKLGGAAYRKWKRSSGGKRALRRASLTVYAQSLVDWSGRSPEELSGLDAFIMTTKFAAERVLFDGLLGQESVGEFLNDLGDVVGGGVSLDSRTWFSELDPRVEFGESGFSRAVLVGGNTNPAQHVVGALIAGFVLGEEFALGAGVFQEEFMGNHVTDWGANDGDYAINNGVMPIGQRLKLQLPHFSSHYGSVRPASHGAKIGIDQVWAELDGVLRGAGERPLFWTRGGDRGQ